LPQFYLLTGLLITIKLLLRRSVHRSVILLIILFLATIAKERRTQRVKNQRCGAYSLRSLREIVE
jgi:hypothetical protein